MPLRYHAAFVCMNWGSVLSDSSVIRLTEYSHGAGCGCKISPKVLDTILASQLTLPVMAPVKDYIAQGSMPGGTERNFESYGEKLSEMTDEQRAIICDPQTSGGLLIAVRPEQATEVEAILAAEGLQNDCIGELVSGSAPGSGSAVRVTIKTGS